MLENINIKGIKNTISVNEKKFLSTIHREENSESILGFLNKNLLNKYFSKKFLRWKFKKFISNNRN